MKYLHCYISPTFEVMTSIWSLGTTGPVASSC